MYQGKIKKVADKGFGFISVEGRPKDVFFHASALKGITFNELQEGDSVTIETIESSDRGDVAKGVGLDM